MNKQLSFFKRLKKLENEINTSEGKRINKFLLVSKELIEKINQYDVKEVYNETTPLQENYRYIEGNAMIIAIHIAENGKMEFILDIELSLYYTNLIELY